MTVVTNDKEPKLGSKVQITKGDVPGDNGLTGEIVRLDYPSDEKGKPFTTVYKVAKIKWIDGLETNMLTKNIVCLG